MLKLKSIYIDGLHNASMRTYQLNDLVYFYGRNGVGKTTILYAIQLALLGYIPGVHKTREAILKHSRDGRITVRLDLDDNGQSISIERKYALKASKTTITPEGFDIQSIIEDIELPIFNFNEFIDQTANKLKDYFIKNILPSADGGIDWPATLKQGLFDVKVENPSEVLAYGLDLISGVSGSPIEQVAQANTRFREEQSFNRSELNRLQATIDSLIYYSDYKGPKDINELNSKLLSLGALRDALIRYESARQMISKNQSDLQILKQTFEGMGGEDKFKEFGKHKLDSESQYIQLQKEIKITESKVMELGAKKAGLLRDIQLGNRCQYTGVICPQIDLNKLREESDFVESQLQDYKKLLNEQKTQQNVLDQTIRADKAHISQFQDLKNQIDMLGKSLGVLPEKPATDKTLVELDLEIQQLNDDKAKLQANIAYEATIENITKLKYKSELNNEAIAAWIKLTDTNGLQTTLTEKPFEDLANTMTAYIQDMYGDKSLKAKFEVSTKANSFSFGLIRGDKYLSYDQLSSGEKCLYTLALMICIVKNSKSPLKVLLCDDMFDHLDSTSIENTFLALKCVSDIQFILAGVKDCKNASDVMVNL